MLEWLKFGLKFIMCLDNSMNKYGRFFGPVI